jgi:hypothetical protein
MQKGWIPAKNKWAIKVSKIGFCRGCSQWEKLDFGRGRRGFRTGWSDEERRI